MSGIIHVLYAALNKNLYVESTNVNDKRELEDSDSDVPVVTGDDSHPTDSGIPTLSNIISEQEANMAVHLTEWFQEQRRVYEQEHVTLTFY